MKFAYLLLAGFTLLSPTLAGAQQSSADVAPDQLVKNVTNEVLEIVRTDKDIKSGNSKRVIELVEAKVLPHFNFTHMTQLAMGQHWPSSKVQQKTLTDEFRTLLVRTYSKALTEYKNQTIEFRPFSMKAGEADVKVRTKVIQARGAAIPLDYFLEKQQGWKVYDIEVDGASLVTNYRATFAGEVGKNGVEGLIRWLQDKNRNSGKP